MNKGGEKNRAGLLRELEELRARVAELERKGAGCARAEAALSELEERFAVFMDRLPGAAYMKDEEGRTVYVNRFMKERFGAEEWIGRTVEEFLPSDLAAASTASDRNVLSRGPLIRMERVADRQGRERFYQLHKFPIHREGKPPLIGGIALDITEHERMMAEKARLEEQLRQSQKMESIGRLAGGVAHDFNNLLQPIIGFSELAFVQAGDDERLREQIQEVLSAARSARRLTRQLLTFSRTEGLRTEILDLNEVVRGFEKMLRRLVREGVEFEILGGPAPALVQGDRSKLEQVLLNLSVNASDAMAGAGKLTLETAEERLGEEDVRTRPGLKPGDYVTLTVRDTGVGMDEKTRERAFEPFFTTKKRGEGTGLGLSTVHGVVQQHEGLIEVNSEPGRGAVFRIFLPRAEGIRPEAQPALDGAPGRGGGETVLVVEDDKMVRRLTGGILASCGYRVLSAGEPEEALTLSRKHSGPVELLLTDLRLPEMNGRELFRSLSALRPEMKVLYMSGYGENAPEGRSEDSGGVDVLQKPFSVGELARRIRERLDN